jgi:hypothetical protein
LAPLIWTNEIIRERLNPEIKHWRQFGVTTCATFGVGKVTHSIIL